MKDNFDDSFENLMGVEGKYSNNPADPGGETMWGITARVARKYGYISAMKDLPKSTAKEIAKKEYWDVVRADDLPKGLDYIVFDAAYNSGPEEAKRWMDYAGGLAPEGVDPAVLIMRFLSQRLYFMASLAKWPDFGKGWARRIAFDLATAANEVEDVKS